MTFYTNMQSPVGDLLLTANDNGLTAIHFEGVPKRPTIADDWREQPNHHVLNAAVRQLSEYFARRRREFDLPLSPTGTHFQCAVWEALREIPYGQTQSYGQIARRIARPNAVRAVGAANGANPLPIVVPCHRVIGGDGSLTGFGGGLDRKQCLLALEGNPPLAAMQRIAG